MKNIRIKEKELQEAKNCFEKAFKEFGLEIPYINCNQLIVNESDYQIKNPHADINIDAINKKGKEYISARNEADRIDYELKNLYNNEYIRIKNVLSGDFKIFVPLFENQCVNAFKYGGIGDVLSTWNTYLIFWKLQ